MRLRCLLIALTFAAAFASDACGQSRQSSAKAGPQTAAAQQERGTEKAPVVVRVLPAEKTNTELEAENENQQSGRQLVKLTGELASYAKLLFVATGLLALAAAGLAVTGFVQVRDFRRAIIAAERSAGIAEKALTELERPFIGIEIVSTGLSVSDPKTDPHVMLDDDLRFRFANYGRTPATITEMFDEFHVCGPSEMPAFINVGGKGIEFPFGVVVGANRKSPPSTLSQSDGLDRNVWVKFTVGEGELFLIGFVRFRDIFDRRHITGFCLRFNKRDGRFLFDGDERYNYTRPENHETPGLSQPT
jgi:hypothetical protein